MIKKIKYIFLIFFLIANFNESLKSQDIQAIAVIVNDEVISRYDVNQRVRLILVTSGIPATEENVKRIEEQASTHFECQFLSRLEVYVVSIPFSIAKALKFIANNYLK